MTCFPTKINLEVCIDSLESALIAAHSGAHRLEVYADLKVGGLTPSVEFVKEVLKLVGHLIPISVLIRPRPGNFIYENSDVQKMVQEIQQMKSLNIEGFVFGALNKDHTIDVDVCQTLLAASSGFAATFHRAFDKCINKKKALEDLILLKFKRILTSGGPEAAEDGIKELRELILQAETRIVVMPVGGVTENNIEKILMGTYAREIHSSARTKETKHSEVCLVKVIQNMRKSMGEEYRRRILQAAAM